MFSRKVLYWSFSFIFKRSKLKSPAIYIDRFFFSNNVKVSANAAEKRCNLKLCQWVVCKYYKLCEFLSFVDLCFISINRLSQLGLVSSLSDISLLMSTCLKLKSLWMYIINPPALEQYLLLDIN